MDNCGKVSSLIENINSMHKKECAMSLIEINRLILDIIEKVNNDHGKDGEDYIDSFTIQAANDGILLTLWEREFPIYIDLEGQRVEYNGAFDNCKVWTMDSYDFNIIAFIMQYLNNALHFKGGHYHD